MRYIPTINHNSFLSIIRSVFWVVLLSAVFAATAHAQLQTPTDAATPAGIAPGAPSGSYSLSGFENVNLYNGNLNINLPLLKIGGRGGAQTNMSMAIDSTHWRMERYDVTCPREGVPPLIGNWRMEVAQDCNEAGTFYYPNPQGWDTLRPGYGPGVMITRKSGVGALQSIYYSATITSLTFIAPDGTEYELHDQPTNGWPKPRTFPPFNRGKVFVSSDGSAMTFVSTADIIDSVKQGVDAVSYPSGYLMMADGTRYDIVNGLVRSIRDRNGNLLKFTYGNNVSDAYSYDKVTLITDSLNRTVNISYTANSDTITYKGFDTASRTIQIQRNSLANAFPAGSNYHTTPYNQLFTSNQGATGASGNGYNPTDLVTAIVLPDNRRYQFYYNPFGEVARVELPTGAAIEYDYTLPEDSVFSDGYNPQIYRRVTKRRVYPDGGTGLSYETEQTYAHEITGDGSASQPYKTTTTVEERDAGSHLLSKSKHYFDGSPIASLFNFVDKTRLFSGWNEGKETKTESFDANGTVLRTIESFSSQRATYSWWSVWATQHSLTAADEPANDPRLIRTETTLNDSGQKTKQEFDYDAFNNQTEVRDYGYGENGSIGSLMRRTVTSYLTTNGLTDYTCALCASAAPIHIRRLPVQQSVYDASGTEQARTTYEYDNYANDTSHKPLTSYPDATHSSNISGLCLLWDTSTTPNPSCTTPSTSSYITRGNTTKVSRWLLGSSQTENATYQQYDIAGNVIKVIDPRGNATTLDYTDRFGSPDGNARLNDGVTLLNGQMSYALPTSVTNALGQTAYSQYDYYMGAAVDGEDINGMVASGYYIDDLDRPTQVVLAANIPALRQQKTFDYDDTNLTITVKSDLKAYGDNLLKSQTIYDKLGRITETRAYESGTNYVATRQVPFLVTQEPHSSQWMTGSQISNPFRPYLGEQPVWTTKIQDSLGRGVSVKTPDNAEIFTSYSGNQTTVADQAGKQRKSITDALGRLITIYEAPNTPNYNYQTSYTYDVLGNLRKVEQGSQHRYFVYDSLSRLLYARNPEQETIQGLSVTGDALVDGNSQWSLAYTYDSNGNLSTRTDARGIATTYNYDALNRNTNVTYTDGTPAITRRYDSATMGKGRLWQSETGGDTGTLVTINAYDGLGHPLTQGQQFKTSGIWGQTYTTQRSYILAGQVASQTYPSGHIVNYEYDDAVGRLAKFKGNLGDGVQRDYALGFSYDEAGRIREEQYGTLTPLYHKLKYNVRGQLYDVRLSTMSRVTSDTDWNRGCLAFYYSAQNQGWGQSASDNNGNLIKAENYVPLADGGYYLAQDNYSYDSLNRLTQDSETPYLNGQPQTGFAQAYDYDRYGNRTINQSSSLTVNHPQFQIETATNRMYAPGDLALPMNQRKMKIDEAGNLTYDSYTGMGSRTYDAENRMTAATDNSSQTSSYTYDADGRRVRRKTTTGGEVWQVYGMDGELLAEYAANNASFIPTKEYGYRSGQLLVTASNGDEQRLTRFINQLYRGALGRDASTTELQASINSLGAAGAQSEAQLLVQAKLIAQGLFEPAQRTRTDREYVQDLYWAYFGRAAEIGSLDYWASQLQSGAVTRAGVRGVCEQWGEFTTIVAATWGGNTTGENERTEHFLWNVYLGAQGYVPSAAQMQPQIDALNTASAQGEEAVITKAKESARAQIEATAYTSRNRSDSEYVIDLYQVFWQRAPDATELSRWTSKVTSQGRASVLTSFAESTAFRAVAGTLYRETLWLIPDQLGTPRMIAERTGSLAGIKRHDYLPFGEEVRSGTAGRTDGQGYVSDAVRQQFTSKERDNETGLDYFGARYYSSTVGRFTSADPIMIRSSRINDPQRLNLYGHARENPLKYLDPDGEDLVPTNEQSAAQLRVDLDKLMTKSEAANIKIEAGKNIAIVDSKAIDPSAASPAYQHLLEAISPGVTRNYTAVAADQTITSSNGETLNVGAGLTVWEGDPETATVVNIYVPTTDGLKTWGTNGQPIDEPRYMVTGHEAFGHGTCGLGNCAVDIENEMRRSLGLPERSGSDHEPAPGEKQRPGNQVPPTSVEVTESEPMLTTPSVKPIETIPMRPLQPLIKPPNQ